MSTPETAMAARMYPSMAPAAAPKPVATAQPAAQPPGADPAPRRFIDVGATTMYPNSNHELPAGHVDPKAEAQADATASTSSPDAVAEPAPTPQPVAITPEAIEAAIPAEIKAQRAAERSLRNYSTAHLEVLGPAPTPEVALAHQELVAMAFDHGLSADDLRTVVNATREFGPETPPSPAILAEWAALKNADGKTYVIDDQELADAQRAIDRDPRVGAILVKLNVAMHPAIIKMLARSGQRRSGR